MFRKITALLLSLVLFMALLPSPALAASGIEAVALAEYQKYADGELTVSDLSKYNDWYYSNLSEESGNQNYTSKTDNWNTAFVCWCAEQCGYIDQGFYPAVNKAASLQQWFEEKQYPIVKVRDVVSDAGRLQILTGDIVFFNDDGGKLRAGIVTAVAEHICSFVVGNANGNGRIELRMCKYSRFSRNTVFVHVPYSETSDAASIPAFLRTSIGLNPAAVCGIMANISSESGAKPTCCGDDDTSYGICQWHNGRWDILIEYCNMVGLDWHTLDGQLAYLQFELENDYPGLLVLMNSYPSTREGAYAAAYDFCIAFERPTDAEKEAEKRGDKAADLFSTMYGGW